MHICQQTGSLEACLEDTNSLIDVHRPLVAGAHRTASMIASGSFAVHFEVCLAPINPEDAKTLSVT